MRINRIFPVLLVFLLCAGIHACSGKKGRDAGESPAIGQAVSGEAVENKSVKLPGTGRGPTAEDLPVGNHPPVINKAALKFDNSGGKDILRVVASASDPDGDDISLEYRWYKNNKLAGTADSLTGFKRGDRIMVEVRPTDGTLYGNTRTLKLSINNTAPQILEGGKSSFDGNIYSYHIKAVDADGDPLTFKLAKAPIGMKIDKNGLITWEVPQDFRGKAGASVVVSDGHNGTARYDFTVTIN